MDHNDINNNSNKFIDNNENTNNTMNNNIDNGFYGNFIQNQNNSNFYNSQNNIPSFNNQVVNEQEVNNIPSFNNQVVNEQEVNNNQLYNTNVFLNPQSNNTNYNNYENEKESLVDDKEKKNNHRKKVFKYLFIILILVIIITITIMILAGLKIIKLPWLDYPEVINLSQNEVMLKRNTSYQFSTNVYPSQVNFGRVIYESSNPDIATVNPITGFVETKANGTTTIKAYLEDYRDIIDTCEMVVSNNNVMVEEVTVANENIDLLVGKEHLLKYEYFPKNAGIHYFNYLSSDESILKVDTKGMVTALQEGRAMITILEESSGKMVNQEFTVYNRLNNVTEEKNTPLKIKVSTNDVNLSVGGEQQIIASIMPEDERQLITWTSINSDIATVTENGIIKGVNYGKTQIILTAVDGTNEVINVTVQEENIPIESMNIKTKDFTLEIGNNKKIEVTIKPSKATNQRIIWSSSDDSIASIDQSGMVTGIKKGKALITATTFEDDFVSSINVTVTEEKQIINETDITLSSNNEVLSVGGTSYIKTTIIPSNATNKNVTWSSNNQTVATVSNGMIYGKTPGNAIITVTTKNKKISKTINVLVKAIELKSISMKDTSVKIGKDGEYSLSLTFNPSNATNKSVTWSSSNTSVVTVNSKGIVTAVGLGTASITATSSNGKTATCTMIVTNENIPVTGINLNSNQYIVKVNGKVGATPIINPSTATNQRVTWKSGNTSIAKVESDGTIIGVKEGVVKITATSNNGKSTSAFVVVKNANPPIYYLNGSTIKYWVDNTNSTYSVSHIWVNNAYNQMKVEIPKTFGTLATPYTIMNRAIEKNKGKTMIGVNASGFVTESFSKELYNLDHKWKNTSVSPVVIYEGKILRDFSSYKLPSSKRVYGINKNNDLVYFSYTSNPEKNQDVTKNMTDAGIKYTFAFSPVLVTNSAIANGLSKQNNIRQGVCQIDKNNFVLITNTSSTRSKGFSHYSLAQKMVSLGCKTGFNLDGGGSTSLYYTKKGASKATKIRAIEGTYGRAVADILYFVGD